MLELIISVLCIIASIIIFYYNKKYVEKISFIVMYDYKNNKNFTTGAGFLPIAMKVAAQTVGLDLVSVQPLSGPIGQLHYYDFKYHVKWYKRASTYIYIVSGLCLTSLTFNLIFSLSVCLLISSFLGISLTFKKEKL